MLRCISSRNSSRQQVATKEISRKNGTQCFACYRRCIQTYVAMFEQGIPLERLAVPA